MRKRLLSYYLDGDTTVNKLKWVREGLEEYVKASRNEVEEIEDSSCEVIPKEEPKKEVNGDEWNKNVEKA